MKRALKWLAILFGGFIGLIVVLAVVGSLLGDSEPDVGSEDSGGGDSRSVATPTATTVPTPTPTPFVASFSGNGDRVVGPVELREGVLSVLATHSGSANFIVSILDEVGWTELSINEIGRYQGARAHQVSAGGFGAINPGDIRVEVRADGPWTLQLSQEQPSGGQPPPLEHSDSGDDVLSWILLREGQYVFSATHSGRANFIVQLIKDDGRVNHLVLNEIGSYSGERVLQVQRNAFGLAPEPGLYALVVQADGNWSVNIQP